MPSTRNGYISPLGDLLDLLTITILRISHSVGDSESSIVLRDILASDISKRVVAEKIELADILTEIVRLSQANQEIWSLKEAMSPLDSSSEKYAEYLVLAHQLNGLRNQARNRLSSFDKSSSQLFRSNTDTDGLERS